LVGANKVRNKSKFEAKKQQVYPAAFYIIFQKFL
jgi:hypothetical protein